MKPTLTLPFQPLRSLPSTALLVLLAIAVGSTLACTPGEQGPPRIEAGGETLEGEWGDDGLAVFRGIPYASPPVGGLRWRPPQANSARPGVQQASRFAPACPQIDRIFGFQAGIAVAFGQPEDVAPRLEEASEHCLYLNIWTANVNRQQSLQPVMVWIHGGSNRSGWGSEVAYRHGHLARRGVVLVTINYRLGALGFWAHPALTAESEHGSSGNYGLLDQIEALRWVKRNITAFGGDPGRVTIFGESAGSLDVISLMSSPLASGLFHRAIAQSGAPMGPTYTLAAGEEQGVQLAEELGVGGDPGGEAALAALREIEGDSLIRRMDEAAGGYSAGPIVDGWVLPKSPGETFAEGQQEAVPLVIGSTAHEFTSLPYFLPPIERTTTAYRDWVGRTFGDVASRMLELYPVASDDEVTRALADLITDSFFTCPTRIAARRHQATGQPVYRYYFTRVSPGPGGEALGAYHSMEVPYVFDTRPAWLPTEPEDLALVDAIGRYWTQFAATGDPNGPNLSEWPVYDPAVDSFLELGASIRTGEGVRTATCDLLAASATP